MRFQICPPLHAFRGMEMDAVGGQFFSQSIVLHGHGQNVPAPVTTYALFREGKFVTQSIQSDKKFLKLAAE